MTRDEILKMKAGIDMDILIVTRVMGYERLPFPACPSLQKPTTGGVEVLYDCPRYSTYIAAAWEVVEKMKSNGWDFFMENAWRNRISKNVWWCMFENDDCEMEFCSEDITAQLAICKAALLAVMK
jgi:hypothetical protein